jgi:hypothetical protein
MASPSSGNTPPAFLRADSHSHHTVSSSMTFQHLIQFRQNEVPSWMPIGTIMGCGADDGVSSRSTTAISAAHDRASRMQRSGRPLDSGPATGSLYDTTWGNARLSTQTETILWPPAIHTPKDHGRRTYPHWGIRYHSIVATMPDDAKNQARRVAWGGNSILSMPMRASSVLRRNL